MARNRARKNVGTVAVTAAIALGLAGCQPADGGDIQAADAWVKAGDGNMTGMFVDLSNSSADDIALVGASSPVASMVEIHEAANGVMREKDGGVVIPAGGEATLMPGGDHVMLMGLTEPILAGDTVSVVLEFDDGTEMALEVLAKDFAGANEEYDPGHGEGMGDGNEMETEMGQ